MQAALIGALNGVIGDYLVNRENPLAIQLGCYLYGRPVPGILNGYTEHFPDWKDTVCIFLHGAAASETVFENYHHDHSYTSLLYDEFHALPVLIRYNSGLHISENGRTLAELFHRELESPLIRKVIIIGHSMGGLLFRSACHYGFQNEHSWLDKVDQVFYLGSPHLGAPLEKFGAWAQAMLGKIDSVYTQTAAKLINIRSNGIKDLRHGYLTDEEWMEDEQHDFPHNAKKPTEHIYHLENARHYLVAATLHANPDSMIAEWFGDIMVRKTSALAACKHNLFHLPVDDHDMLIVGGHNHIKLLESEEVYQFIKEKLGESAP